MHTCWLVIHAPCDMAVRGAVIELALAPFYEGAGDEDKAAEWDWYQIGGRWTGLLDGYDPEQDPANRDPFRRGEVKWPTEWRERDADTQPIECWHVGARPYWLVTPDGKLTGLSRDEGVSDVAWPNWHRTLLERWAGYEITVVDCHR